MDLCIHVLRARDSSRPVKQNPVKIDIHVTQPGRSASSARGRRCLHYLKLVKPPACWDITMSSEGGQNTIDNLHAEACARGASFYHDPANGYAVFTAVALKRNNSCCGCGCRHCPFGHMLVPVGHRDALVTDPWMEENADTLHTDCDILFWSGGKDAFLALRRLQRRAVAQLCC